MRQRDINQKAIIDQATSGVFKLTQYRKNSLSGTNSATSGIVPGSGGLLERRGMSLRRQAANWLLLIQFLERFSPRTSRASKGEPHRTEVDLPRHGRSEPHSRIQR
jgi:hypothetical protein